MLRNTAEGYANGDPVTVGTSGGGSGDAFNSGQVAVGAGSSLQASTSHPLHGSKSYKLSAIAGETAQVGWNTLNSKNVAGQIDGWYLENAPSVGFVNMAFRGLGGTGVVCSVQQRADLKLELYDTTSTLVSGSPSAGTMVAGIQYTFDARIEVGVATNDGKVYVQAKRQDNSIDATISMTTVNLGTAACGCVRFGKCSTGGAVTNAYMDNVSAQDGVVAFITPVTNNPPTANAGVDQTVDAGSTITLAGSGSDSDGSITTYAWTKVSGPTVTITNANQANATVTQPAGHSVYRLTVTDNDGTTASDDVNVYGAVLTALPELEVSNAGAWVGVGVTNNAAGRTTALADSSDATYIESPSNPAGAVNEQQVLPLKSGQTGYPYRLQADTASPARSCTVALVSGTTVIASETRATTDTVTPVPIAPTWQDYTLTLNPTQMSALAAAGGNDLRLRFTAS